MDRHVLAEHDHPVRSLEILGERRVHVGRREDGAAAHEGAAQREAGVEFLPQRRLAPERLQELLGRAVAAERLPHLIMQ
jgi:hypothetical protein